jgi:hypothetical protein
MPDAETDRDYIGECALHQSREGTMSDVYAGLSHEDRMALARMITDGRPNEEIGPWIWRQPPEEL